jgi:predicted DNA-binding transcriptional regulator AlpA
MTNYKFQAPLTAEYKEKRNQTILQMRQDGHTLQSIANKYSCSREWIRLILKNDLNTTDKFKFNPQEHCKADEYSSLDVINLTGYHKHYISKLIQKNWIPKATRIVQTCSTRELDAYFWKKSDIDKWIEIKIKYLKIALEGFLDCRLNHTPAYKFTHPNLQKRYKFLTELHSGHWKGRLSYNTKRNNEVMKEFNNLIKPIQYVPNDYSKYLNQKTNDDYAKKGLFNHMKTAKILDISDATIKRYRLSGVLKEGEHYFAGDHYHHRYMYDPKKTKKAMINAGYDVEFAQILKDSKRNVL